MDTTHPSETPARSLWPRILVSAALLLVAGVGLFLLLDRPADRPGRDATLQVTVTDFAMSPSPVYLDAEETVTLVFTSESDFTQNLSFGREARDGEERLGFEDDLLQVATVDVSPSSAVISPTAPLISTTLTIRPNETVTVELTAPADATGAWHAGCFLGHGCDAQVRAAGEIVIE